MPFVTGLLLIDTPASALNNLGNIPGEREENTVGVKLIRTREGAYPYVSAQAFRYWLRTTLEKGNFGWQAAPVYREEKIAYTDANPIRYWDDDLFGYMRAPSKRESARTKREADTSRADETPTTDAITRISPFRVSTLVSIAPVTVTNDFGTMSRHEGDPVPHEHQFYRTTLKGLFSLDLHACGTFWYRNKTGYRNLDEIRKQEAASKGLLDLATDAESGERAYRLPLQDRIQRLRTLFEGLAHLEGGAKQTLHYTDVSPVVTMMAVTRGGNHMFGHIINATVRGLPQLNLEALNETLRVFRDDVLSPIYVGWTRGYLEDERQQLQAFADQHAETPITISHPREAFQQLARAFAERTDWLA